MEEIFKKIEEEAKLILKEQEELKKLEEISEEARHKFEEAEKEVAEFSDKESGFYKEAKEKATTLEREFKNKDIDRMNKDRNINNLVSEKKQLILKEIEEKKQYIDENRNVDLEGNNLEELKAEKEKLEKEIELNNTTKEKFNEMSDSEKMAVRKAKENYLNNKHRLEEISPTVKLMETLDGKEPKDRYMEFDSLMKNVDNKFNRENLEDLLQSINVKEENDKDIGTDNIEKNEKNIEVDSDKRISPRKIFPKVQFRESVTVEHDNDENPLENIKGNKNAVNEIILDVSHNKVKVLGDQEYELLYKKTAKDRKTLKNWAKNYFINKNYKNIDYTLLSILKQMGDNHEDVDYLNAISGGEILNPDSRLDSTKNSIAQESLENLAKSFKIKYVFDREAGILTDYRAKRLARYAHKIGLAEIEGISEKGFLDVLKEKIAKIRETRLFAKKEEPKALTSGEEKTPKQKIAELLNQDREGIRNRVKVENRNNRIEENAQRMERETQETMKTDVKDIINENNKDNEKTL